MTDKPTLVADGDNILIHIPMCFKKRGGRTEIIAPEGLDSAFPDGGPVQQPIVTALARARRWQEMLKNGQSRTNCSRLRGISLKFAFCWLMFKIRFASRILSSMSVALPGQAPWTITVGCAILFIAISV